jgi:hypothetical protein
VPHSLVLSDSTVGRADGRTFVFIRSSTDGALDAASWGMSDNVGLGTDARASGLGGSPGIAILSYNRLVTFGISADCESTPDPDVLAYGVVDGFDELTALVPEIEQIPQEARFSCPYV